MTFRTLMLTTSICAAIFANEAAHAAPKHKAAAPPAISNRELLEEVKALRAKVEALEARADQQSQAQAQAGQQVQATTAQAQVAAAKIDAAATQMAAQQAAVQTQLEKAQHPDKFAFKGISITPGGFIELSGIYRQHDTANDIASNFNAIPYPITRTGHTQESRLSARHSRFTILAEGDASPKLHLAMYGEFDFLGAAQTANSNESNSYNPRIRNLYATVDWKTASGNGIHLLAGQNWSLVTLNAKGITPRAEVQPPVIDSQYVPGYAWARQPGLRIAADFLDKTLWIAVSAENPQTTFYSVGTPRGATTITGGTAAPLPGTLANNIQGSSGFDSANSLSLNHIPDLIGKVAYEGKAGKRTLHIEAFGLYRDFYDRVNNDNDDQSGWGFGGSIAGQLIPGVLDAQFSGLYGKGVGRYGTSQLPDVTFRSNGHISPIREYMLLAGLTLHATKMLDLYAFAGEEVSKGRYFSTAGNLYYGYGNPLYTNEGCTIEGAAAASCNGNTRSIKQATVGFSRKLYQGPAGRVQVGAQYSYTERQAFVGVGGAPDATQNTGFVTFRYYPF